MIFQRPKFRRVPLRTNELGGVLRSLGGYNKESEVIRDIVPQIPSFVSFDVLSRRDFNLKECKGDLIRVWNLLQFPSGDVLSYKLSRGGHI